MKTNVLSVSALLIGATLISLPALASQGGGKDHNPAQEISQMAFEIVSPIEEIGLLKMREEEKLARDVYLTLYDTWGVQIFSNIAASEQRHTDAVKALLNKYSIADPVTDDTVGVFYDAELQGLYDDLVAKGNTSVNEAYQVGATIEDLDIYDLKGFLADTDNEDITKVYESLERGSRNHLRAFMKQINQAGETYTAQFLSQEEFDNIVNSEQEKCGNSGGKGKNHGNSEYGQNGDREMGQGRGRGQGKGRGMGRNNFNQDNDVEGFTNDFGNRQQEMGQRRGQGRGQSDFDQEEGGFEPRQGRGQGGNSDFGRGQNTEFPGKSTTSKWSFYDFISRFFGSWRR